MTLRHLVLTGLCSALANLGLCTALWLMFLRPPGVVAFDMKGTMNAFIRQSAGLELTDEQRKQLVARFNRQLTSVTEQYAREHRVSILVSPAAVAGVPDVTRDIQAQLAREMQAGDPP
jgi:conjugal transfer pilin signal peptidase TrbI